MTTEAWHRALDDLEVQVVELAAATADPATLEALADDGVPPFAPPTGLGALPTELAERAAALLDRLTAAESAARAALAAVRKDLQATQRLGAAPEGSPLPRFVDTTA